MRETLRFVAPRGGRLLVFLAAVMAWCQAAFAQTLEFEGRVEALHRAELASQLNGLVARVLFDGGEPVAAGQALIELDDAEFALAVATSKAELARAEAELRFAEQKAARTSELSSRGVATDAEMDAVDATLAAAKADVTIAETALQVAELNLARTTIRAPIDGFISRPSVAPGTFLEAEAGPALATIVQLDPVLIAYRVPYSVRLQTLETSGAETLEDLFGRITLTLVLPNGQPYDQNSKPRFASATVDDDTGELTIWARVSNPAGTLRPGMKVTVLSDVSATGSGQ